MRDFYSHHDAALSLGPAVLDADATGAAVDLLEFQGAAIELSVGVGGIVFSDTNKIEFVGEHSNDGSTWVKLTDDDVQGVSGITNGIIKTLSSAHAAAANYRFGYHGCKRYVRVSPNFSGTHGTGTPMACLIIKAHPGRSVA